MRKVYNRPEYLQEVSKMIPSNPICAEVGVWVGDFTKQILDIVNPSKMYLIDPWEIGHDKNGAETYGSALNFLTTAYSTDSDLTTVQSRFSQQIEEGKVSLIRKYSYDAVNMFENSYFDFVYIDACHLYECVKQDLINYMPKVKQDGLLCGHDYFNSDNFGVIQAVDEFCENYNYEMVILNVTHNDGFDWALKKR